MRKKLAITNIAFSLLLEVVTVLSGFIIPRLMIQSFGSASNGLVNSITSFVGYISILQLGVGSVIKAAMYKPLAQKDGKSLNTIVRTTENFFAKIGVVSCFYIGILAVLYPIMVAKDFDYVYTASLIVIIGIGTVAQYLFGITYQMLLEADQRSYVYSVVQIATIVLNTIAVIILIRLNCSIQIVKLASAVFFVLRPIVIGAYSRKKYSIDKNATINSEIISQRWEGFSQGIAYFIHSKTDVFVLTLLSTFASISVYSVYALVTTGLTALINCVDKAVRAAFGNIFASNEIKQLRKIFSAYNNLMHIFIPICFSTAAVTIYKFIEVYVSDVKDTNYIQPVFGTIMITAEMFYCLRLSYNGIVFVAGRFKETRISAYIEAILNIVISVALIKPFGIVGVAIGTLVAMIYRTVAFIVYLHKEILELGYCSQIKRFLTTISSYMIMIFILSKIHIDVHNYYSWAMYASVVFLLSSIGIVIMNLVLDFKGTKSAIGIILRK